MPSVTTPPHFAGRVGPVLLALGLVNIALAAYFNYAESSWTLLQTLSVGLGLALLAALLVTNMWAGTTKHLVRGKDEDGWGGLHHCPHLPQGCMRPHSSPPPPTPCSKSSFLRTRTRKASIQQPRQGLAGEEPVARLWGCHAVAYNDDAAMSFFFLRFIQL